MATATSYICPVKFCKYVCYLILS